MSDTPNTSSTATPIAEHPGATYDRLSPTDAAWRLSSETDAEAVRILQCLSPALCESILTRLPEEKRASIFVAAPVALSKQWQLNITYPEQSVGRLLDPAIGVFPPSTTVEKAVEGLRDIVKSALITYVWVAEAGKLVGVVAMRELLFAAKEQTLDSIMIRNPFTLDPRMPLGEAMKLVVHRHFPVYPVCLVDGTLVGSVRGETLFREQALENSAQMGSSLGVGKEERISSPMTFSFRSRHPWLQINLITAFMAGGVVSMFEDTISRVIVLASFLPILAGQSGNTGCQTLAVILRGIALDEIDRKSEWWLPCKEGILGFFNGMFVGVPAGGAMYFLAMSSKDPNPGLLALVVFLAMVVSCSLSGFFGALTPLVLRRLGFDAATSSSIFVTTFTDIGSMGTFLLLASILVPMGHAPVAG